MLSALALATLLGCSKITQENFAKVKEGMSEQEVIAILGEPTESSSVNVLGISGTTARWVRGDTEVTIRFVNGQVALKRLDKPAVKGQ
jgi:hypothetical protein